MQINSSLKPFSFSEKLLFKSFQDKKLDGQVINKSFELKNKGIIDKIEHLFNELLIYLIVNAQKRHDTTDQFEKLFTNLTSYYKNNTELKEIDYKVLALIEMKKGCTQQSIDEFMKRDQEIEEVASFYLEVYNKSSQALQQTTEKIEAIKKEMEKLPGKPLITTDGATAFLRQAEGSFGAIKESYESSRNVIFKPFKDFHFSKALLSSLDVLKTRALEMQKAHTSFQAQLYLAQLAAASARQAAQSLSV